MEESIYTLADLWRGSQAVNADSVAKGENVSNFNISDVRYERFYGTKSIQAGATVRSYDSKKAYNVQLHFYGLESDDKPSFSKSKVRVNCGCPMFYFYYAYDNHEKGAHVGRKPRPYEPVPADKRKHEPGPPLNPSGLPGVCKHVIATATLLKQSGHITD